MAENSQHTPGPWTNVSEGVEPTDADRPVVSDQRGRAICQCSMRNGVANSRLIAAAPELLEACKALKAVLDNLQWGQRFPGRPHAAMDAADAAISKASSTQHMKEPA